MDKVVVRLINHSSVIVESDSGIAWELRDHFSFFVPGYKFMPKFRNGVWDGKIKVFDYNTRLLPAGLFSKLEQFCSDRDYNLEVIKTEFGIPGQKTIIDKFEITQFIDSLNLHSNNKPINVRDHQLNAICSALEDERILLLSPTGSGKSLVIYCLLRWYLSKIDEKLLVIVPTTSLVEQMYSDFDDYSSHDDNFSSKDFCHKIYSGKEKTNVHEKIFISTWQSIYKLPKTWFRQFGVVFGDEAHRFAANSLVKSMEKAEFCRYRIGLTGTLDDSKTNATILEGVFGRINRVARTVELQKKNQLAKMVINVIFLEYPEDVCRDFGKVKYQSEIDWIVRHPGRNKFIRNLSLDLDGNTLVMFQFIEKHGKILYDMIKDKSKNRTFYVAGEVDKNDREAIRHIVETQQKSTIIASSGVFSTGVNIKNLHNLILTSPSKAIIGLLQSIGRVLRVADNGMDTNVYDIVDDLRHGKYVNYAYTHAQRRLQIYRDEGFEVKIWKVKMK